MSIKIELKNKPEVLVTDFDRTLTYLYRDSNLLLELASKIRRSYEESIIIPDGYLDHVTDGYFVWHKLHDFVSNRLSQKEAEIVNKEADELVADFELEIIKRIGLFSGIPKAIRKLRSQGIRLGLVSSNATTVVEYALKEANLLKEFEYVAGRPQPFRPELIKPNPYPLNIAQARMEVDPSTFWYVGDDKVDMLAATAANVSAIGVCTGKYSEEELFQAGADMVFESFHHIPEYLQKL